MPDFSLLCKAFLSKKRNVMAFDKQINSIYIVGKREKTALVDAKDMFKATRFSKISGR